MGTIYVNRIIRQENNYKRERMNFRRRQFQDAGMKEAKRLPPYQNLAKWRLARVGSQERLADRLDISQAQVSRYETGEDQMTLPVLHAWAEAIGIEPEQFWSPPDAPRNELAEAYEMAKQADETRQRQCARLMKALLAA